MWLYEFLVIINNFVRLYCWILYKIIIFGPSTLINVVNELFYTICALSWHLVICYFWPAKGKGWNPTQSTASISTSVHTTGGCFRISMKAPGNTHSSTYSHVATWRAKWLTELNGNRKKTDGIWNQISSSCLWTHFGDLAPLGTCCEFR